MEVKGDTQRILSNFIYFVLVLLVDPAIVSDVSKYLFPIMVAYIIKSTISYQLYV